LQKKKGYCDEAQATDLGKRPLIFSPESVLKTNITKIYTSVTCMICYMGVKLGISGGGGVFCSSEEWHGCQGLQQAQTWGHLNCRKVKEIFSMLQIAVFYNFYWILTICHD
jgi:hypothetical protein